MTFPNKKWRSTAPLWPLSTPQMIDCLSFLCTLPLSFLLFPSSVYLSLFPPLSPLCISYRAFLFFCPEKKRPFVQNVDKMIYLLKNWPNLHWNCPETHCLHLIFYIFISNKSIKANQLIWLTSMTCSWSLIQCISMPYSSKLLKIH